MTKTVENIASDTSAMYVHEEIHQVVGLLLSAVGQLHDQEHPAHVTLLKATSLLRRQIDTKANGRIAGGNRGLLAWQARRVREYIDGHIAGPVRVMDLPTLVRRSEAHFSRAFRSTFGTSPQAFVISRRVELAARFMLGTEASLSEIALRCGFVDQSHLSKHFRRAVGQTPAAWRRSKLAYVSGDENDRIQYRLLRQERSVAVKSAGPPT